MRLTKAQKEALARKAMAIVDKKRGEKKNEYVKNWKPNKEVKKILESLEKLNAIRLEYMAMAEKLGFLYNYSGISTVYRIGDGYGNVEFSFSHNSDRDVLEDNRKRIMEREISAQAAKEEVKFPTWDNIMDELELSDMDQSFDMQAFLKKYEDL